MRQSAQVQKETNVPWLFHVFLGYDLLALKGKKICCMNLNDFLYLWASGKKSFNYRLVRAPLRLHTPAQYVSYKIGYHSVKRPSALPCIYSSLTPSTLFCAITHKWKIWSCKWSMWLMSCKCTLKLISIWICVTTQTLFSGRQYFKCCF